MNKRMPSRVKIHNLDSPARCATCYTVERWQDAHDDTDRSAAQEAFRTGDVITMGRVIAEPLHTD